MIDEAFITESKSKSKVKLFRYAMQASRRRGL
jgi:hypothetical protein